ncbi:MAG: hypothetical protein QUS33_07285 [Dehalococcoidia bacterium]|nr:hypothetical protein [Dehalococcoidia bacterium]
MDNKTVCPDVYMDVQNNILVMYLDMLLPCPHSEENIQMMEVRAMPDKETYIWLLGKHYAHRIPVRGKGILGKGLKQGLYGPASLDVGLCERPESVRGCPVSYTGTARPLSSEPESQHMVLILTPDLSARPLEV